MKWQGMSSIFLHWLKLAPLFNFDNNQRCRSSYSQLMLPTEWASHLPPSPMTSPELA
jgi:hypothetical protein